MARCLTILAIATIFSGCCSVPAHVKFECPDRFEFSEYSQGLWGDIPENGQLNISADDLAMKEYIKSCEARAGVHND